MISYEWRTKYLLLAMDMAKVGGPPLVVNCEGLYFRAMCKKRVSSSGWSPIGCEGFHKNLNIPSPLPTTLVFPNFVGYSYMYSMYADPKIAKVPYKWLNSMVYVRYNYS